MCLARLRLTPKLRVVNILPPLYLKSFVQDFRNLAAGFLFQFSHTSSGEVRQRFWPTWAGTQSAFHFIPNVLGRDEVRALRCSVKLDLNRQHFCYGMSFVHRGTAVLKLRLLRPGWKLLIIQNLMMIQFGAVKCCAHYDIFYISCYFLVILIIS